MSGAGSSRSSAASPCVASLSSALDDDGLSCASAAAEASSSAPSVSDTRALLRDDLHVGIDLVLHIDLDVGLGAGLDFGVIFRQVHFGEIERLELFRREAAAIGLLGRAPSDPIEALEQIGRAPCRARVCKYV